MSELFAEQLATVPNVVLAVFAIVTQTATRVGAARPRAGRLEPKPGAIRTPRTKRRGIYAHLRYGQAGVPNFVSIAVTGCPLRRVSPAGPRSGCKLLGDCCNQRRRLTATINGIGTVANILDQFIAAIALRCSAEYDVIKKTQITLG